MIEDRGWGIEDRGWRMEDGRTEDRTEYSVINVLLSKTHLS